MSDNDPNTPAPADQPAIIQPERDRTGPLGPKDVDSGPEGDYPDPDEYAGADDGRTP
jgi:hypothetical protein